MVLEFCGQNYTLLKLKFATPEELNAVKGAVTEKVNKFKRGKRNWDGDVSMLWYLSPYYYVPATCWRRLMALREPDNQTYRPAYDVVFEGGDKFFNKTITIEDVTEFVGDYNQSYDDVSDQITALHSIIVHRMSSHHIATGFGKTFLSYLLSQYTKVSYDRQLLMIVPRVQLLFQAIDDFNDYQKHLPDEDKLKMYLIGGNAKNTIRMQDANVIVGTYQSLVDIPEEQFDNIATVIADEGHTSKALSVASVIKKCSKAELVTAISGTMAYMDPVDALTIESYCGPMILSYPVWQQIEKGRLPKVAIQPVKLTHSVNHGVVYNALLSTERLPKPSVGMDPDKASLYRNLEMKYLAFNENMIQYLFTLTEQITRQGKNILIVFKNVMPCINAFEYFKEHGQKSHLIIGATPTFTRKEIIGQIENEVGWALVATDGTMSMGVSIKNFHAMVVCMIGKSPHVTLQAVGRMLRNHTSKDDVTYVYDIFNDLHEFGGTSFDLYNFRERQHFYKNEQYHVLKVHDRTI